MKPTQLLYLQDMQQLVCTAYVENIAQGDTGTIVYLDQTVFYPQGGGQPYDQGTITSPDAQFNVTSVRFVDGQVQHIGTFEHGSFMQGEDVTCSVDESRRQLHTRLHSAGHVVDMAVAKLGYDWIPVKGYHFPDGPYVEYQALANNIDREVLKTQLDETIATILGEGAKTEIRFVNKEEMGRLCRHVPDYLPKDKPGRVVMYGDFGVPCGGTHVVHLKDIGKETIRKIKIHGDTIRISYEIS